MSRIITVISLIVALASIALAARTPPDVVPRWEYTVLEHLDPFVLDRLGKEGWELAVAVPGKSPGTYVAVCRRRLPPAP
jgi:hypothetical protein